MHRLAQAVRVKRSLVRCMGANTIFSLSSGHGKCGVSIIRVSGPQTKSALQALCGRSFEPKERYAYLKALHHPVSQEMIDKGLVLWFPGPGSFTGEDLCEFQVHGSVAVVAAILDALGKLDGLRTATPGEFTKRAFYGGKMDLTEVEGLADLIHAETEAQRKQALLQSTGALSRIYGKWRKRLIRCCAHLEAYIDFAEDENIEDDVVLQLKKELERTILEIRAHLDDQRQGEMLRDGVRTAIIGAPNVGKSSFLNLLCQRQISIVTDIAGTTRDVIETTHNFGGYPVVFADTAGLRQETDDVVEQEGIARARECLRNADLIFLLMDAQNLVARHIDSDGDFEQYTQQYMRELGLDATTLTTKNSQLIVNKVDLLSKEQLRKLATKNALMVSCHDGHNIKPFLNHFEGILKNICGQPTAESPRITHARYREQLDHCMAHIKVFLDDYAPDVYPDMAISAQKLRKAVKCIERITGHVSTDDILDVVFRDFCIGK